MTRHAVRRFADRVLDLEEVLEGLSDRDALQALLGLDVDGIVRWLTFYGYPGPRYGARGVVVGRVGLVLQGPRVVTLTGALEEASTQVRALRGKNDGLQADIAFLRREVGGMLRMCMSMQRAMQRAVDTGYCAPLKLWLDLNPAEDVIDATPAA